VAGPVWSEFEAHSGTIQRTFGAKWDATTAFAVDFSIVGQPPNIIEFLDSRIMIAQVNEIN